MFTVCREKFKNITSKKKKKKERKKKEGQDKTVDDWKVDSEQKI